MTDIMTESLTPLRVDYKQQTRTRILKAAAELICEDGEDAVTMASVAARAGISERTVYRHFANRGTLVRSVWEGLQERLGPTPIPRDANDLIDEPLIRFPRYDDERELVRAYLHRRRRVESQQLSGRQQAILQCLEQAVPELDQNQRRRRAAIVQLITSPDAWDLMCRTWGFDGIDAGDAAAEALWVLLNCGLPSDTPETPDDFFGENEE